MTVRCFVSDAAKADISTAKQWYDERIPGIGSAFILQVGRTIHRIGQHPDLYQVVVDDLRRARIHQFPYSLLYRILADEIDVVAVRHNRRQLTRYEPHATARARKA